MEITEMDFLLLDSYEGYPELYSRSKIEIIKEGKHLCGIECADDVNKAFADFIND